MTFSIPAGPDGRGARPERRRQDHPPAGPPRRRRRAATGTVRIGGTIAYVPQTERYRLDFPVDALDVVLMGTYAQAPALPPARPEPKRLAVAALDRVGLADRAGEQFGELSGGQRQRVLIARALAQEADVILLDEPLSGVDRPSGERILAILGDLRDEGRSILVSTHDIQQAQGFDSVLCVNGGQVYFGPPVRPDPRGAPRHLRRRDDRPRGRPHGGRRPAPRPRSRRGVRARMIDWILDPLRQGITQRALLELAILGVVCGPLGVWVVLFRQSYAAESIAHAMLPGLVLAALVSAPLGLGAAAGLAVAAALIAVASRQSTVSPDVAVAVTVTTLFGLGTLLALSPDVPLRLGELLFGDPLSVSTGDLVGSACLAAVAIVALTAGHRTLLLSGFDPQSAGTLGAGTGHCLVAADLAPRPHGPDRRPGARQPARRRDRRRARGGGPAALLAPRAGPVRGRRDRRRVGFRGDLRELPRGRGRRRVGRPLRDRRLRHRPRRGAAQAVVA